ncbi:unnamed protein product, partial [Mesorhabditis belari]|uniref:Uncharacterized protein n=1 Tax=Mesorhabditis belari TaxID=2138241 RepID=A0AAF3FH23_9BILA
MFSNRLSEPGPSASELLEASKKLYVKTAILRHTKLAADKPRMFISSQEESDLTAAITRPPVCFAPLPSTYNPLSSPSTTSAFKRVTVRFPTQPPPLPPKSDLVRERSKRHSSTHRTLISLRSLPDCSQLGDEFESSFKEFETPKFHKKPIPKPRLSRMAPLNTELTTTTVAPVPLPRRKTSTSTEEKVDFNNCQRFFSPLRTDGPMVTSKRNIAKSSPNLVADGRPITGIRRRILAAQGRSVTPLVQINQEPKMDQYAEEKDFLTAAMHDIEFGDDDDLENEQPEMFVRFGRGNSYATTSFETPILVSASSPSYSPPTASQSQSSNLISPSLMSPSSPNSAESGSKSTKSLSTPTSKDSGFPHSDAEEEHSKRQGTSKSDDDGFFDTSGERKTDGEASEGDSIFTSVTNQPKRDDVNEEQNEENRGKPISELERKARVMRWINEAATTQI